MLIKEFRDTLRTLFYCLFLFLTVPIARLLDWRLFHTEWELSGIWQLAFMAVIIIFAAYSGVSVFHAEKKDHALEYLFSLPLPRWKIIFLKVLPRFLMVLLLIAAGGIFSIFDTFIPDGIGVLILFLTALFMSLAVDSLLNGLFGVLVLNIILYYTSLVTSYITMEYGLSGDGMLVFWFSQFLPAVLLLAPFAVAFGMMVKNMDLKPLKWQAKPYLFIALPTVFVLLTFILVFLKGYIKWMKH
ncbi:MAG: hypothetical protein GY950_06355 [bacterium]|nr:hypothetical protein [bacterium]